MLRVIGRFTIFTCKCRPNIICLLRARALLAEVFRQVVALSGLQQCLIVMLLPLWLLVSIAASFAISYTLVPRVIALCGRSLGRHLRRKTRHRRELLLARSQTEKKHSEDSQSKSTLDGEWEKVERSSSDSSSDASKNGNTRWHGVVGFFHPFWSAELFPTYAG